MFRIIMDHTMSTAGHNIPESAACLTIFVKVCHSVSNLWHFPKVAQNWQFRGTHSQKWSYLVSIDHIKSLQAIPSDFCSMLRIVLRIAKPVICRAVTLVNLFWPIMYTPGNVCHVSLLHRHEESCLSDSSIPAAYLLYWYSWTLSVILRQKLPQGTFTGHTRPRWPCLS